MFRVNECLLSIASLQDLSTSFAGIRAGRAHRATYFGSAINKRIFIFLIGDPYFYPSACADDWSPALPTRQSVRESSAGLRPETLSCRMPLSSATISTPVSVGADKREGPASLGVFDHVWWLNSRDTHGQSRFQDWRCYRFCFDPTLICATLQHLHCFSFR